MVEPVAPVSRGERNIAWIEKHCRIPEGKLVGQPVKLDPFQKDILIRVYDNPHGTRKAIISFGRKNAKTTLAAFLLLLHLVGPEAKPNSQLYSTAQSREQASLVFNLALKCLRLSPTLHDHIAPRESSKVLTCPALGTVFRALSAEHSTAYGLSPAFVVHDELGQVVGPTSALYEAVETAMGAQEEPLSLIISTQAPGDNDLLSLLIDDAATGADPHTVLILYTTPTKKEQPDIDYFSEEAVRLANPAFDTFMNKDEVMRTAADARRMPTKEASFRNLILNQRVSMNNPFVAESVWKACDRPLDEWEGEPVFMGLDLSSTSDLTALVEVWRSDSSGRWNVRPTFWTPGSTLEERAKNDRAPYVVWRDQGFLRTTPGPTVDYAFVAHHLREELQAGRIEALAFDRWRYDQLKAAMERLEVPEDEVKERFLPFGQGFASFTPALEALERELLNANINHAGHPVLTWNAANAVVVMDPAGNRKLDKSKASGRIDGMIALAMAICVAAERTPSLDDFSVESW